MNHPNNRNIPPNRNNGGGAPRNGNGNAARNGGTQKRTLTPEEQAERRRRAMERKKKQDAEKRKQTAAEAKEREKRRKALEKKRAKEAEARRKAGEKLRRHEERFELTEEEKAIREQMRAEEREYNRNLKKKKTKVLLGRVLVFFCMFALLLSVSVGLFYANLVHYEPSAKRNFTYSVDEVSNSTVAYEKMMRNGVLYLNMTPIVSLCDMAVTGDTEELRYISHNAKENVQFIVGSRQVFINGVEERLASSPVLDGEDLYVPYSFFTSYVNGLDMEYNEDKNKVTIAKAVNQDTGADEDMTFVIRSDAPMTALDEYNEFGKTSPIPFESDLDLYESFMNPENRDDYLILVNAQYPLDQNYVPNTEKVDLSDMLLNGQTDQYLNGVAYKAMHAMILEMTVNGYPDVKLYLGYRSYGKQRTLYNSTVADYQKTMSEEQAQIAAASVAQMPGCNPQQAGLSFIMHNMKENSTAFSREPAYGWLAENCWKFGFIIRYPADKTAETGMAFQPYFFTFVGRYHAMRIHEAGLSMEEYIAQLDEKNYFGMPYADFRQKLLNKTYQ